MDAAQPTIIKYELTIEDYREMTAHLCAGVGRRKRMPARFAMLVIVFATAFTIVRTKGSGASFAVGLIVGAAIVLVPVLLAVRTSKAAQQKLEPRLGGAYLCSYELSSTSDELMLVTPSWRSSTRWSAFIAVEETQNLILLKLEASAAYAIPKRALPDAEQRARFRRDAELRIAASAPARPS